MDFSPYHFSISDFKVRGGAGDETRRAVAWPRIGVWALLEMRSHAENFKFNLPGTYNLGLVPHNEHRWFSL